MKRLCSRHGAGEKASALANSDLGALDPEVAGAIVWACDQVLVAERCLDQFPVDQFQGVLGPAST